MNPSDGAITYLFTQGVLGVACIVLGWVAVKLYNKNERLQNDKDTLQREKEAIIEARRVESNSTTKEVLEVLQSNSQSNTLLAAKIEAVKSNGGSN